MIHIVCYFRELQGSGVFSSVGLPISSRRSLFSLSP